MLNLFKSTKVNWDQNAIFDLFSNEMASVVVLAINLIKLLLMSSKNKRYFRKTKCNIIPYCTRAYKPNNFGLVSGTEEQAERVVHNPLEMKNLEKALSLIEKDRKYAHELFKAFQSK